MHRFENALTVFFRGIKAKQEPSHPRLRSHLRFDTMDFPEDWDGCPRDAALRDQLSRVRLHGVRHTTVHQHRRAPAGLR